MHEVTRADARMATMQVVEERLQDRSLDAVRMARF